MSTCPLWLRVTVTLSVTTAAFSVAPAQASAQQGQKASRTDNQDDVVDRITQMNKDAVAAYQAKKYDDARKILKQGLDAASAAGLAGHPIAARTHVHLGVVMIVGFGQREAGISEFKKAVDIQPDIKLTRILATPELSQVFAEAKTPAPPVATSSPVVPSAPASPTSAAAGAATASSAPVSPPPVPDGGNGLMHEPVAEAKQGSAISITVTVQGDLQFEKLVLAYRPDGGTQFLGREMNQAADGQYNAEIPAAATSGGAVAYYVEAQDAEGGPIASRGTVDVPLEIHLVGVGAARHEAEVEEDEEEEAPEQRYFLGLMAGGGFGWATGNGDTNVNSPIRQGEMALAGVGQIAPEFGYWLTSSLLVSGQLRYEVITGTTDVYQTDPAPRQYHTANYALALFAKATWRYGKKAFHPLFSLAVGGGRIRHVVNYGSQLHDCGPNQNQACVDTIGAGPVLVGPGAGFMYAFGERTSLVVQVNTTLGFPTFTVNVDGNVGVAFGF